MSDPIIDASVKTLIAEFTRSGVRELHLRSGSFELFLSNDQATPSIVARSAPAKSASPPASAPAAAPPPVPVVASASATDVPADAFVVRAPNLGTFYRAPKPGAAVYVEVGSMVAADTELCLIEVMKLFTAVRAGTAGKIHSVLADDGSMVEAGQPLFAIVSA